MGIEAINAHDKELLTDIQDALANCMKCGNCMAVCPIYKELGKEGAVARGKLALMEGVLSGKIGISAEFEELIGLCLCCKACAAKCPCGVKPDELVIRARQAIMQARGLHPIKKGVFKLLSNRPLFDFSLRMAGVFAPLSFKKLPGKMAAVARFPMPGLDVKKVMAPFAATPLRSKYSEVIEVKNAKMRVGFFTGCTINYMYTDIGDSLINVLKYNNIEVVIPKNQHCCGTPVSVYGDKERAKVFARHLIEVFEDYKLDYVVAACGTCTEALKEEYPHWFADDPQMKARAEKLAKKTYEISEFLVDVVKFKKDKLGAVHETVTMHDSCHMARGLHVTKQPREVLKAIPGLKFVEMKDADRCCGSAGSFSIAHYELSREINDKKVSNIKATGAGACAVSCPACRMHIMDGLVQNKVDTDVPHVVQLLDRAYKAGKAY
jgi:glycolate oxidase iron-sulfur subunit